MHSRFIVLDDVEGNPVDARALIRLQADHASRVLVPAFYRYLQAHDEGIDPLYKLQQQ